MNVNASWSMRFALALSAVFAIGALAAGGISYTLQTRDLSARLQTDVQALAESIALVADSNDPADLAEQINAQVQATGDLSVLVAWVNSQTGDVTGNFDPSVAFLGARQLVPGRDLTLPGQQGLEAPDAYAAYGIQTPLGPVYAARDTAWITESGEILIQTMIWGLGAALLLSIGLAVVIARRNEARITAMETVLDRVGSGHFEARIEDHAGDDLGRLAAGMNTTFDRLQAGVEAIRQVSTDIAHDLRAPLMRLRMRIEPFAIDPDIPTPLRQASGTMLEEIDTLAGSFEAILRLSRLQSGSVALDPAPVDLGQLAADVYEFMCPVAEDNGQDLRLLRPDGPKVVEADRELLLQALVNLVENAILHCPAPATIEIGVGTLHGRPVFWVADDGAGIAPEDRGRVTERFVRLDKSRTMPGSGLGLSLVSAIARLHGGHLDLSGNDPGLRATVVL
ncbi:sensor histidine kinase [Nioella nitratireducens]|uniref:sensor histidine kinase n=1 Tax=Nioella nitratireducens TaxID=1287720 RepID=UPI0008FD0BE0|nr:HAMP domain-containing sensor histidine kinase [Nioella nitratireducens]